MQQSLDCGKLLHALNPICGAFLHVSTVFGMVSSLHPTSILILVGVGMTKHCQSNVGVTVERMQQYSAISSLSIWSCSRVLLNHQPYLVLTDFGIVSCVASCAL